MRYIKMKLVITLVILLTIAAVSGFGRANNSSPHEEIAFSRVTNDLSTNELLPALLKEFGETTRGNVERGKQAISLIFNNANRIVTQNVLDQPQWQEGRCTLCHFNTGPANFTTARQTSQRRLSLLGQDDPAPVPVAGEIKDSQGRRLQSTDAVSGAGPGDKCGNLCGRSSTSKKRQVDAGNVSLFWCARMTPSRFCRSRDERSG